MTDFGAYERPMSAAAAFAAALMGEPCEVIGLDGIASLLPASRWSGDADASDEQLLRRCRGATVDIGCGPGRMTQALARHGHATLGIDVVATAVDLTRARGAMALQRDIFQPIPGEGRWTTALLADGNIGIGGDPTRLLQRVRDLLDTGGRIVADVDGPGGDVCVRHVSLRVRGARTRQFPWATVPANQLARLAEESSLRVLELTHWDGRWFAQLERAG